MANNKPFLSGWLGKLALDPKASANIRAKDMMRQINNLNEPYRAAYDLGVKNYKANDMDLSSLNNAYGITDMGAEGVSNLANDPWHNGNVGKILGGYAAAHPIKTAATAGLGLVNLGGLTDNDYYGGQIAGLLAGGLGSRFLGSQFSPMAMMAGGALGSLFDKLRQKQADSRRTY